MLARAGGPRWTEAIRGLLPDLPDATALEAALRELVRLGRVELGQRGWDVCDRKRRLVRSRDLSDATVVDGKHCGGWNGWLVQCAQRGMLTLDEAIAEGIQG